MDFSLTDEQRSTIDAVRRIRQDVLAPNAKRWLSGEFPHESIRALAEIGVMGMAVPQEYGGLSASILDTVLVLEEISKACYVTGVAVEGELGVQTRILSDYAPERIRSSVLPRVVDGTGILSICMTEPDAGTDVPNYRTNCEVIGDRVILRGAKTLISRAELADVLIVFTRVNGVAGSAGIGCILVERGTPGMTARATYHTMGGEFLCDVTFDDCELPLENLVLKGNSMKTLMSAFNTQRCLNASMCLGLAEGALEEAVRYMNDRKAFGQSLAGFQGLRWKIADMYVQVEAARGLLYRAATSGDKYPDPTLAAAAKIYCNEMAVRVTSEAIQIHGGYGFTDEFAVSRLFRGARYGSLGGGTTETLRNLVGKQLVERLDAVTGLSSLNAL